MPATQLDRGARDSGVSEIARVGRLRWRNETTSVPALQADVEILDQIVACHPKVETRSVSPRRPRRGQRASAYRWRMAGELGATRQIGRSRSAYWPSRPSTLTISAKASKLSRPDAIGRWLARRRCECGSRRHGRGDIVAIAALADMVADQADAPGPPRAEGWRLPRSSGLIAMRGRRDRGGEAPPVDARLGALGTIRSTPPSRLP